MIIHSKYYENSNEQGFTLIELAVVIIIIAILMAGGIEFKSGYERNNNVVITKDRMDNIEKHLQYFIAKYKRLPCPTKPTVGGSTFSYPNGSTITSGTKYGYETTDSFCDNPNGAQTGGEIPWLSLGLPESMAEDGWGNKFIYRVDPKLTLAENISVAPIDGHGGMDYRIYKINTNDEDWDFEENLIDKGIFVCQIFEDKSDTTPPNDYLDVEYRTPSKGTGAAYVLISSGENAVSVANTREASNIAVGSIKQLNPGVPIEGFIANVPLTAANMFVNPPAGDPGPYNCLIDAPIITTVEGVGGKATYFDDIVQAPTLESVLSETHMAPIE